MRGHPRRDDYRGGGEQEGEKASSSISGASTTPRGDPFVTFSRECHGGLVCLQGADGQHLCALSPWCRLVQRGLFGRGEMAQGSIGVRSGRLVSTGIDTHDEAVVLWPGPETPTYMAYPLPLTRKVSASLEDQRTRRRMEPIVSDTIGRWPSVPTLELVACYGLVRCAALTRAITASTVLRMDPWSPWYFD